MRIFGKSVMILIRFCMCESNVFSVPPSETEICFKKYILAGTKIY